MSLSIFKEELHQGYFPRNIGKFGDPWELCWISGDPDDRKQGSYPFNFIVDIAMYIV